MYPPNHMKERTMRTEPGAYGQACLAVRRAHPRPGLLRARVACGDRWTRPQGWLDELLRMPGRTARPCAGRGGHVDLLRLSPHAWSSARFPTPGPTPSRQDLSTLDYRRWTRRSVECSETRSKVKTCIEPRRSRPPPWTSLTSRADHSGQRTQRSPIPSCLISSYGKRSALSGEHRGGRPCGVSRR